MTFDLNDKNYEIIKPIGQGGMSTVYLAKDKNLDRLVAIKLLHPTMSSDERNRNRLKIEALAIARISHENIVNVYNFVNTDKHSYIVMEYIDGTTLSEFIEKNAINSPELLLSIFLKILKGINFSHKKNIIHRDIKPENIMISRGGKIKIMDFGIASIIDEVHNLTTTGSVMGSPMFMSPEHLTDEKIDKQSDLFSLGIILYWMLTKAYPFKGKNTAQLLNNILKCQYQNPQRLSPLISNDIKVFIKKALQKSKEIRYQSSNELLNDVENYLKNLNFDYQEEVKLYFKNKTGYHKHFMEIIPDSYLHYSQKLFDDRSFSKAIAYAQLSLEYNQGNHQAKNIIKKIERGNIFKKQVPIGLIIIFIISLTVYFLTKEKNNLKVKIHKHTSQQNTSVDSTHSSVQSKKYNYRNIYKQYKKIGQQGYNYLLIKMYQYASQQGAKKKIASSIKSAKHDLSKKPEVKKLSYKITPLKGKTITNGEKYKKKKKFVRKIIHKKVPAKNIKIETRISPKAASVYIDDKLYGYGNINKIELKSQQKYKLEIKSNGCHSYKTTLFYKDDEIKPLAIRLKWKAAKLKVLNPLGGDIFINNNYKGNYSEYNYEIKPSPLSNGSKKLNLKIIKNSKIIFKKDVLLKAGQTLIKKI